MASSNIPLLTSAGVTNRQVQEWAEERAAELESALDASDIAVPKDYYSKRRPKMSDGVHDDMDVIDGMQFPRPLVLMLWVLAVIVIAVCAFGAFISPFWLLSRFLGR